MFKKAEKKKSYLRLAIVGPSGSGKTYTALEIATGLSEKTGSQIAVIDSEHGSAQLYADKFDFVFTELNAPYSIKDYINAIKEAEKCGIQVLVIDSTSHGWQYILDYVDMLANSKYKGNSFRAWSEGTPLYNEWIGAMLAFKGHIIVTMRAKTEYAMETVNGKTSPQKIGMGAENRKGIEYEFTMLMEGSVDHYFNVTKDRTSKFQDRIISCPSRELGYELFDWLNQGEGYYETKPYVPQTVAPAQYSEPVDEQGKQITQTAQRIDFLLKQGLESGYVHKTEEEALRRDLNTSKLANDLAGLNKLANMLESRKNTQPAKKQTSAAPPKSPATTTTSPVTARITELQNKVISGMNFLKPFPPFDTDEGRENFLLSNIGFADVKKCRDIDVLQNTYSLLAEEYKKLNRSA